MLVNAPSASGLGERGLHVAAAFGGAVVLCREGGRLRTVARFCSAVVRLHPETIYGIDNAVTVLFAALVGRTLFGSRFVLDTGDAIGPLRAGRSWIGGLLGHVMERIGYLLAWKVVARSTGLANRIQRLSSKQAVVIPDGCDLEQIPEGNGEDARVRWHCGSDTTVIGVVGSANWNERLGWCYGRDVIEAVARSRRNDLMGVLVVSGDGVPRLRDLAANRKVSERIIFDAPLPGYDVYKQIQGFDVAVSTQTDDEVGQCRTTGKLIQYIAAGKFVLASRVGEAARILPEEMLVPYRGAWDEDYFARLADRIDGLPARAELSTAGLCLQQKLAEGFDYHRIFKQLIRLDLVNDQSNLRTTQQRQRRRW